MHAAQTQPVRLLIVERQPVVTPEVRARLAREPGFAVVGRVSSAVEATRFGRDQGLDMVLVESTFPSQARSKWRASSKCASLRRSLCLLLGHGRKPNCSR